METLIKVDPDKHMYRWYSVGIQGTLVDGIAVIYGWGSLKSAFQQWRTITRGRGKNRCQDTGNEVEERVYPQRRLNFSILECTFLRRFYC